MLHVVLIVIAKRYKLFKANEYTSRKEFCHFHSCILLIGGQLLKGRICSCRSKFFPSRADPFRMDFAIQGSKPEVMKLFFPFVKMAENRGVDTPPRQITLT